MKNQRTNKGFTITELVIVIAVIAILAAVLIPTFGGVIEKANRSAALMECKNSLEAYQANQTGMDDFTGLVFHSGDYYFVYINQALHEIDKDTMTAVGESGTFYFTKDANKTEYNQADFKEYTVTVNGAEYKGAFASVDYVKGTTDAAEKPLVVEYSGKCLVRTGGIVDAGESLVTMNGGSTPTDESSAEAGV